MTRGRGTEVPLPWTLPGRTLMIVLRGSVIRPWARLAGVLLLAAALTAPSFSTVSAETDRVTRRGRCSDPSRWALTVRRAAGDTLGVRLVVTGGRADQKWNVFLDHNGEGFFAGSRTSGTDGLFIVRRRVANLAGADTIRFAANNVPSNEICRGQASL